MSAMDIRRITEVGVAVRDLEAACALLVDLLGGEAGPVVEVPRYDMRYRMCRVGKVDFELMEPTAPKGVIHDFLERRGEGLHHVAFAVDDLAATMAELADKSVVWVDDEPVSQQMEVLDFAGRRFADGEISFAFSHPRSILGILFEFIQYPAGYQTP